MKRAGMEKHCIRAVWILAETADPCRIKKQNCDAKGRNAGILHVKQEG